jgi:hypothetical protein
VARTTKERRKIRTNTHASDRKILPAAPGVVGKALSSELVVSIDGLAALDSLQLYYRRSV